MELLERQDSLNELSQLAKNVSSGEGRIVLISGEAGIGKTTLIKYFTDGLNSDIEVLLGNCDALFTPRPLGPLYDLAHQIKSNLINLLDNEEKRISIFNAFLNYLESKKGLIITVIEDIHWADEATLDLLKFICRRIIRTKCLLILSYRDDEISSDHPIRLLLGDLPNTYTKRIRLYPFSENAVTELMKNAEISDDSLYTKTGGNPFFVSEVLTNKQEGIPVSIKDAILSRTLKLSDNAKRFVEVISVIPSKIKISFIEKLFNNCDKLINEGINKGILLYDNNLLSFRHELTRLAIMNLIPALRLRQIHGEILYALINSPDNEKNLSAIVHHSVQSGNKELILKYAPLAAKHSSQLGAHREAATNYKAAIKCAANLPDEDRIKLYVGRYYECYLTGQIEESIKACEVVHEILTDLDDTLQLGENYRRLSRLMWFSHKHSKSVEYNQKAIDTLEKLPPNRQLAMSYSNRSQLYMLENKSNLAVEWGEKAIKLARRLNDPEIEIHALNNIGIAKLYVNDDTGESILKTSLTLSLQKGIDEHASRAYVNLAAINLSRRNLEIAHKYFSEGIEHCNEKDVDTYKLFMMGGISKVSLDFGNWDEAVQIAETVLKIKNANIVDKIIPLTVIGIVRARRNDPGTLIALNDAVSLSLQAGEFPYIFIAKTAKAEAYWLLNKLNLIINEIETSYLNLMESNNHWHLSELAFWLWKGGKLSEIPDNIAKPYLLHIKGDWRGAANEWKKLGCPYQEALALADGDEKCRREALNILESLGATATINLIKQEMRKEGIKNIPQGPRESTKQNPAGLTGRQIDVLQLLSEGLSNLAIAQRLFISPKTVDHHVSAILSKLNLHSRTEAATFAQSSGITKK